MDEAGNPTPGDVIADKYLIEDTLGEGGMGSVFLARHQVTERVVALKWVRMGEDVKQARLLREARSMARVSHPNVVEVLDAGEHNGGVYMAMDYVDGRDLYEYANRRTLPHQHAVDLLVPALRGIRAAHKAGIIHRDLKPANIIVCFDTKGQPMNSKVLDFGVAKLLGAGDGPKITKTGNMVGTPRYMAPEQLLGEPEVDERTDVYSAGLVLYELVAGRAPFASSDLRELAQDVVKGALPPPEIFAQDLPSDVSKVIMKAAKADMDERYQSVDDLIAALTPFASADFDEQPRIAPVMSKAGSIPQNPKIQSAAPTLMADAPPIRGMDTEPEGLPTESLIPPVPATVKPGRGGSTLGEGERPPTTVGGVATPRLASSGPSLKGKAWLVLAGAAAAAVAIGIAAWSGSKKESEPASANAKAPASEEPVVPAPPEDPPSAPQAEPAKEPAQTAAPAPAPAQEAPAPAKVAPAPPKASPAPAPRPAPRPPAPRPAPKPVKPSGTLRVEDF